MAELRPYPFAALARRMFQELERNGSIFDLPANRFVTGSESHDYAVDFHGHPASSPLGPAAGPQTQMAQNIVLSWLGGCRIMELKTVQVMDELEIPRPCIDVHTVGLNAEWSQELKLAESLDEYVKGAMLIEMLRAEGIGPREGFHDVVYDMSVGYDLAGIQSESVRAFLDGMLDATQYVERFRREVPAELSHLRDLDFPTRLSDTLTLSTFHGCPPDEIERIMEFLLREIGVHSIVKFNPMLLGPEVARGLLHDELGYTELHVPDSAFERDTRWSQAVEIVERLGQTATERGLGFGVKFSNTLIVENTRGFLAPEEKEVYLSGQPLHVLASHLVGRFRATFEDRFPISFSAGVDRYNFPDAVALGLVPVTVCTDLLRKGGYGRLPGYYEELDRRMEAVSATTVDDFTIAAYGLGAAALETAGIAPDSPEHGRCTEALFSGGDLRAASGPELYARWVSAARCLNTEHYVEQVTKDERYSRERNSRPPRKIGSHLELFDCITCDICVPVCPNDANFTFGSDQREIPVVKLRPDNGDWSWLREPDLVLERRHQIANFADFCNDCGNCDIFCPEDGGPYLIKPRFFGAEEEWRESKTLDGFYLERGVAGDRVLGRFEGNEFEISVGGGRTAYRGEGFDVSFQSEEPQATFEVQATEEVDLTYCFIMDYLRRALLDAQRVNPVNALTESGEVGG